MNGLTHGSFSALKRYDSFYKRRRCEDRDRDLRPGQMTRTWHYLNGPSHAQTEPTGRHDAGQIFCCRAGHVICCQEEHLSDFFGLRPTPNEASICLLTNCVFVPEDEILVALKRIIAKMNKTSFSKVVRNCKLTANIAAVSMSQISSTTVIYIIFTETY